LIASFWLRNWWMKMTMVKVRTTVWARVVYTTEMSVASLLGLPSGWASELFEG
jgi:hypothetical protein